jgi:hypothetical protein
VRGRSRNCQVGRVGRGRVWSAAPSGRCCWRTRSVASRRWRGWWREGCFGSPLSARSFGTLASLFGTLSKSGHVGKWVCGNSAEGLKQDNQNSTRCRTPQKRTRPPIACTPAHQFKST